MFGFNLVRTALAKATIQHDPGLGCSDLADSLHTVGFIAYRCRSVSYSVIKGNAL